MTVAEAGNKLLTFVFVRHPFARLVSSYEDKIVKARGHKYKYTKGISGNSVEYHVFNTRKSYQMYAPKHLMKTKLLKPKETSVSILKGYLVTLLSTICLTFDRVTRCTPLSFL